MTEQHFKGCHPEDEHSPRTPPPDYGQEVEACWHCGTLTTRGECGCYECWESADDVPPDVVYHCPTCGRWWAYMMPRITTIVFNPPADDAASE